MLASVDNSDAAFTFCDQWTRRSYYVLDESSIREALSATVSLFLVNTNTVDGFSDLVRQKLVVKFCVVVSSSFSEVIIASNEIDKSSDPLLISEYVDDLKWMLFGFSNNISAPSGVISEGYDY